MASFRTCAEKYKLAYIDLLVPKQRPDYFVIGDLVHLGLALGNTCKDLDKVHEILVEYVLMDHPSPSDDTQLQLSKSWELVQAYFAKYGFEDDIHDIEQGSVELEVGKIDYSDGTSCKVLYTGRKDAMKGSQILERKTAGALNKRMLQMFHKDPQTLGYMLLTPEAEGVIYDMIIKTKTPQFHREEVIVPQKYINRYKIFIVETAYGIATLHDTLDRPPTHRRNLFQCISLIGGECPYRPICDIDNEPLRNDFVNTYYSAATGPPDLRGYNGFLQRFDNS